MNEAVKTLDGWFCLHDFRSIDWAAWRELNPGNQELMLNELSHFLSDMEITKISVKVNIPFTAFLVKKRI